MNADRLWQYLDAYIGVRQTVGFQMTGFVSQPLHSGQAKPLHPLIDKATADPDRRGNGGDRSPLGEE
jgi:hypothetical protein